MRLLKLALLASLLFAFPGTARAQFEPYVFTFDPVVIGNTSGNAITAFGHAGYRVNVLNNGSPQAGFSIALDFSGASGMVVYSSQSAGTTVNCASKAIYKLTDSQGNAVFTPRIGGHDNGHHIYVVANGVPVGLVLGRSTDMNGNGTTSDLVDFTTLSAAYGTTTPEADFNGDGQVGIVDFAIFAGEYQSGGSGTLCP